MKRNCPNCNTPIQHKRVWYKDDCGEGDYDIVAFCPDCGAEWG